MPNKEGGYAPNYTPMVTTDSHSGFIVDCGLLSEVTESGAAAEAVDRIEQTFGQKPKKFLTDAGNNSGYVMQQTEQRNVAFYAPVESNERPFLLRGMEKVKTEWLWAATAFNLAKLVRAIGRLRVERAQTQLSVPLRDLDFVVHGFESNVDLFQALQDLHPRPTTFEGAKFTLFGVTVDAWRTELQIEVAGRPPETISPPEIPSYVTLSTDAIAYAYSEDLWYDRGCRRGRPRGSRCESLSRTISAAERTRETWISLGVTRHAVANRRFRIDERSQFRIGHFIRQLTSVQIVHS